MRDLLRRRLVAAGLVTAVLGVPHAPVHVQGAVPVEADSDGAVSTEVAYLERRVELARGDSFYLLLDQGDAALKLMYGGAVLQLYPLHGISIGRPRALFASVGESTDWRGTTWNDGTVVPPRPELMPVPQGSGDNPALVLPPPTAEEAIPVPERFLVRFEGGRALEVRTPPDVEGSGWWARRRLAWVLRWQDIHSILGSGRDAVRVLVTLDREAAGALYRALPPQTKLLISHGAE